MSVNTSAKFTQYLSVSRCLIWKIMTPEFIEDFMLGNIQLTFDSNIVIIIIVFS